MKGDSSSGVSGGAGHSAAPLGRSGHADTAVKPDLGTQGVTSRAGKEGGSGSSAILLQRGRDRCSVCGRRPALCHSATRTSAKRELKCSSCLPLWRLREVFITKNTFPKNIYDTWTIPEGP